ncbi:metallophosphoesterase [Hyphomicrobium sp. D-2]|uniref:metallophosphoesterase n=1 Tax=Hyphomicrobium sp. D-2 TaxID=3041621 RepID=UPI0024537A33|nr:metallophosphoesterase [Hyphomicrobium sp. D-2]MDH4982237.1 metallophosphoesterase [Hyphomicrobium sp. D-2]
MTKKHSPAEERRAAVSTDWRHERGPFDFIGDVHGCTDELIALLEKLGYTARLEGTGDDRRAITTAPKGRRAVFVGDLIDRGPASPDALRIAMDMVESGHALMILGNHDDKFLRWLKGNTVKIGAGLERTISQLEGEGDGIKTRAQAFLATLPSHAWLDGGSIAVAHAGIRESMLGRNFPRARDFGLYGETSGRVDANGVPERFNWAADYRGPVPVIFGHTPVQEPEWQNNTLCIDTGCVYGNTLTALRWPERELVSVPANESHAKLKRGFGLPPPRPVFDPATAKIVPVPDTPDEVEPQQPDSRPKVG